MNPARLLYLELVEKVKEGLPDFKFKTSEKENWKGDAITHSRFASDSILLIKLAPSTRYDSELIYEVKERTINGGFSEWKWDTYKYNSETDKFQKRYSDEDIDIEEFADFLIKLAIRCNKMSCSLQDVRDNKLDNYKPIKFSEETVKVQGDYIHNLSYISSVRVEGIACPNKDQLHAPTGKEESVWFIARIYSETGSYKVICVNDESYYHLRYPKSIKKDYDVYNHKIDLNSDRVSKYPVLTKFDKHVIDQAIKFFINKTL